MRSLPLPVARALLYPFYRLTFHHRLPWRVQRRLLDASAWLMPMPRGVDRIALRLGERRAERITAGPVTGPEAVLYLHGGGYTVGSIATHRSLAAHLAADLHRPVYLLDYRLAPEHPCPAAMHDTIAAFRALIADHGHPAESIAIAGDSAGGGVALATAQWALAHDVAGPGALVLISPWTDPGWTPSRDRDLVVNRFWGSACAAAYLGGGAAADPQYAPLFGVFEGLPPTYLYIGTREMVHPQCVQLAAAFQRARVPLRYVENSELWHAAQTQAGLVRQSAESVRDIAAFLTVTLARSETPEQDRAL